MRLRTLGGLSLAGSSFRRPKPLLLLAYLALEGPKDRRYLADLFWPMAANRRQSLTVALSQLRKAEPSAFIDDGPLLAANVDCDAASLLQAAATRAWPTVADLYQGPFLVGADLDASNMELEEWLYLTRETLAARAQQAFIELAEQTAQAGDLRASAGFTNKAAGLHPDANGADPRMLARLHALLVRNNDPRAMPLKREAEEVGIELLEAEADLGPASTKRLTATNLPRTYLPFVGRKHELSELEELLESGTRLVTVTGLGGYGKTRLATQLARRMLERGGHDDIYFVSVEGARDPNEVFERVAAAVQLQPARGTLQDALKVRFATRTALLVLDNVEHLTSAATELEQLLEACPGLTLVATSREPLGLYAETVYALSGMSLPKLDDDALATATGEDGLELFTITARRSDPRFRLDEENLPPILDICRRVAGAPLGIELAASLMHVLPAEELAEALASDLDALVATHPQHPPRHASLRTVFEHSWRQLTPRQREALAGASVFVGGFTRAAAQRVVVMDLPLLGALMDRSLITRQGARYDLHPLVQQYAAEKLAAEPAAESVGLAHAEHYAELLAEKGAFYRRVGQQAAFQDLDREYGNVRAAWLWAVAASHHELLGRMVMTLPDYLIVRARLNDLTALIDAALASVPAGSELSGWLMLARAKGLMDTAPKEAREWLQQALPLAQGLGANDLIALIHYVMGRVLAQSGDGRGAEEAWSRALPLLKRVDAGMYYGGCLNNLGLVSIDRTTHSEFLLAALEATRLSGNVLDRVNILKNIGCHHRIDDGDSAAALEPTLEAIALERDEVYRRRNLIDLLGWAAFYLVQLGEYPAADEYLVEAEALLAQREPWAPEDPAEYQTWWVRAQLHLALGDLERAIQCASKAGYRGSSITLLAWHAVLRGDLTEARRQRDMLDEGADGPYDRTGLGLRGLVHLLDGALALQAAEEPGGAELNQRSVATAELLNTLNIAIEHELMPTAFWAFAALPLLAPDHADSELLELAVTHTAASTHARWLAGSLQKRLGLGPATQMPGATDSWPEPLGREEILALAAKLADRLQLAVGTERVAPALSRNL